jgi:poly-beta-1,6-N-acetyl-D-glucosamine synthase
VKWLFWLCFGLVGYTYVGYMALLWLLARLNPRPVASGLYEPSVSIVIAARNEAANLPAKIENLRRLRYPPERIQIVIVSDGSTDATADILRREGAAIVRVLLDQPQGKAAALNEAVRHASGELLFFQDARQQVDSDALRELTGCFADPSVGAASGELLLESATGAPHSLGLYWTIEKAVRKLEASCGSVVGVTGAIYAIRRELYTPMPAGTILDDVFIPMYIAHSGRRVVFQPSAMAHDRVFPEKGREFARKVRTLTGNYQLLQLAPWMLSAANPLLFRFVSHKLLRLLVPLLLVLMLVASAAAHGSLYRALFWCQIAFYALAALGMVSPAARRLKPVALANTFVMLNAAAAVAFYNFVIGRNEVWV